MESLRKVVRNTERDRTTILITLINDRHALRLHAHDDDLMESRTAVGPVPKAMKSIQNTARNIDDEVISNSKVLVGVLRMPELK